MSGIDSNTKLILQGNLYGESSVPDGSLEIIDSGNTGHIITQVGTAQLSTTQKKFGSCSLLLDGNSDYLTIPDSSDWTLTTSFTINTWVRFNGNLSAHQGIIEQYHDTGHFWSLFYHKSSYLYMYAYVDPNTYYNFSCSFAPSTDTWYHIEIVVDAGTPYIFIDGVSQTVTDTVSVYGAIPDISGALNIGIRSDISAYFDGYIDEVRISDIARHTSGFTVPTESYTSDSNTKLLLHFESQDNSAQAGNTPKILTFNGDAQIDTAQYKFGSGSYLFDGTGDYISIPSNDDLELTKTLSVDKTIDFWFYTSIDNLSACIFSIQADATDGIRLDARGGNNLRLYYRTSGTERFNVQTSINIYTINTWHHIVIYKYGNGTSMEFGVYLDGTQILYASTSTIFDTNGLFVIGALYDDAPFFNGWIDELRSYSGNPFNASPNSEKTDTITVPTEAYSTDSGLYIPSQTIFIM